MRLIIDLGKQFYHKVIYFSLFAAVMWILTLQEALQIHKTKAKLNY